MSTSDGLAADLQHYLSAARTSMLRTLEGLSDYDVRRPLTPSGTNLLGLVKHLAGVEIGYLVGSLGRATPSLPWYDDGSVWEGADMWVTAEQTRAEILELYATAAGLSDSALAEVPLETPVEVPWWPQDRRRTTFGHVVVRMTAETAQHAGQAEILREGLDGQAGRDGAEMGDADYWARYTAAVQAAADPFR